MRSPGIPNDAFFFVGIGRDVVWIVQRSVRSRNDAVVSQCLGSEALAMFFDDDGDGDDDGDDDGDGDGDGDAIIGIPLQIK